MLSEDYILGLVEGEGCFSIGLVKANEKRREKTKKKNKVKYPLIFRPIAFFKINMLEKDMKILEGVKNSLKVGKIRIAQNEKYPTHNPAGEFYVVSPKEIDKVRGFFRRQTFVGTKGKDFELWDKCIDLIRAKKRLMREDIKEIALLRDKMNLPKQRKKRYRDVTAVLELWDKEYRERAKRGVHYQKPPHS